MKRSFALIALPAVVLAALIAASCSAPSATRYPAAYQSALDRYPGISDIPAGAVARFLSHFTGLQDGSAPATRRVYAERLYFSDTLLTTESLAALERHMAGLKRSGTSVHLDVLDTAVRGPDVYLVWTMRATFEPLGSPRTAHTIGVSHLRFDAEGRVVLHQDFWDAAEGFYRHLPVVGTAIGTIGRRFSDPGR